MLARCLGRLSVEHRAELRAWFQTQHLEPVTGSQYVQGRLERWYGLGSNLRSVPSGHARVFAADEPGDRLRRFGDQYLPGWHSILACGGPTSIGWHRDHAHFEAEAVMINLGEALFYERASPRAEQEILQLRDGDVIALNIKALHASHQLSPNRWNITWRRIKPEFIPTVLPLFPDLPPC